MADWTNMVPGSDGKIQEYVPSNKKEEKNDIPEVELRGKIEYKKKSWFERCASDFKRYFPKMLFGVAIPEMGKIFVTKTFDVIYNSIFNEPYYGTGKKSNGYYFNNSRVVDYDGYFDARNSKNGRGYDGPMKKLAYDEFLFTNRIDADDIITRLQIKARDEGCVSVSELYSIIKRTLEKGNYPREIIALLKEDDYANTNYGWYYDDLRGVRPGIAGRDRYFLDLPEEVAIRKR